MRIEIIGPIVNDDLGGIYEWWGLNATYPKKIKNAILNSTEDLEVYINSGGGNVYSGFEIYNLLSEYKGNINIKIVGICASAASFISQAKGAKVSMSPLSQMMIHRVSTVAEGNKNVMSTTSNVLEISDNTIATAYAQKSGQPIETILKLMDEETYISPTQALELGLIDEIMFENEVPVLTNSLNQGLLGKLENCTNKAEFEVVMRNSLNDFFNTKKGSDNMTLEEMKNKYPDLVDQLLSEGKQSIDQQSIQNEAIEKERARIKSINELSGKGPQSLINEGIEKGLTAEQVAYNMIINQPVVNHEQLKNMRQDAVDSGIEDIASNGLNYNQQNQDDDINRLTDILTEMMNEVNNNGTTRIL